MASRYTVLQDSEHADGDARQRGAKDTDKTGSYIEESWPFSDRRPVNLRKLGVLPCTLLVLSSVGTAAFISYIVFLWFTAQQNALWRAIALKGWMTRSIAVAAVVLRTSVTMQAGIATSMLAALALESSNGVSFPDLASLTFIRASAAGPHAILARLRLGRSSFSWWILASAMVLLITTTSLQFTSTMLLADVQGAFIADDFAPYNYAYSNFSASLDSKWHISPRPWPVFAEYNFRSSVNGTRGFSDTGITLRALLPISDSKARSSIHTYQGPAPVIDARTVCTRPDLTNISLSMDDPPIIRGTVSIPEDLRFGLTHLETTRSGPQLVAQKPGLFACQISAGANKYQLSDWNLTICNLNKTSSGGIGTLLPYFEESEDPSPLSTNAFLLVNSTGDSSLLSGFNGTMKTSPRIQNNKTLEWIDINQDSTTTEQLDVHLSLSLCLPSFVAWPFNITATTRDPLDEPTYLYDTERNQVRFDQLRNQLSRSYIMTNLEDRRVLSLAKESLLNGPEPGTSSFLAGNFFHKISTIDPYNNHQTIHLQQRSDPFYAHADRSIGGLGQQILQDGGSVAEAMQSMLMGLVFAAYQEYYFYDVPGGDFSSETAFRRDFVPVQVPGGNGKAAIYPAGATRSYMYVMLCIMLHCLVVSFVVMAFISETKHTLLWENWHTIAQVAGPVTEPYLQQATRMRDAEVEQRMKEDGIFEESVAIGDDDSGKIAVVRVIKRRSKSKQAQDGSQDGYVMEELQAR